MSARKKVVRPDTGVQIVGAPTGGAGGRGGIQQAMATIQVGKKPAQHTVRVVEVTPPDVFGRLAVGRQWAWSRQSGNNTDVAQSPRSWPDKSKAARAARAEARLTGARLVIDGQEVTV